MCLSAKWLYDWFKKIIPHTTLPIKTLNNWQTELNTAEQNDR